MRQLLDMAVQGKFTLPLEIMPKYVQSGAASKNYVKEALLSVVAIDAENVHEWATTSKQSWKDHLQNKPERTPFPETWIEWTEEVKLGTNKLAIPMGVLVTEFPCWTATNSDDEGPPDYYSHDLFVFVGPGKPRLAIVIEDEPDKDDPEPMIILPDYEESSSSDSVGTLSSIPARTNDKAYENAPSTWAAVRCLETYLPTLAFLNCHNVTLNKVNRPGRLKKRIREEHRARKPSFHIIEVHKTMVRNVYEGNVEEGGTNHAHVVRGHIKHYGEHNKLFGRLTGSWFWESHVRGSVGFPTLSEYRVWGPSEKHKPKCVVQ